MRTLGILCDTPTDTTSFYRVYGPLGLLRRQVPDLELVTLQSVHWASLKTIDALLVQRPRTEDHLHMCRVAAMNRVPIWLEYDDDFTSIPISNPSRRAYQEQTPIIEMLKLATVITVSTEELKSVFSSLTSKPIVVIPNAFDNDLFDVKEKYVGLPNNTILWRGSPTHCEDLGEIENDIIQLAEESKDRLFVFWGYCTEAIKRHIESGKNRFVFLDPIDPVQYFHKLVQFKPGLVIVPLMECQFNKCKSNIAWIEAMWAGGVVVAPKWPEWNRPGVINYEHRSDTDGFLQCIRRTMQMSPQEIQKLNNAGWDYVTNNRMLSEVNSIRSKVFAKLTS